jgi:hypothetical protein
VIPPPPSDEASGPDAPGGNSSAPPPADDVVDDDDTDTGGEAPGLRRKEARRLWESPSQAALRGAASESDDGDAASIADDAVGLVLGSEEGWEVNSSAPSCSYPDEQGVCECEIYRMSYVSQHWGSFVLVVLLDGLQAEGSPFRPFVFPPPTYPWFNASTLQVFLPHVLVCLGHPYPSAPGTGIRASSSCTM